MIKLENVTVRCGGKTVLRSLTASLPESGLITVSGPSGSGKTTLLRVLCGLTAPDSGSLSGLEGRTLGVMFQEDRLLPWATALQNLTLVASEDRARKMLAQLGLAGAEDLRPAALSGGMARRVALARALLFSNDVLLLDEPFTGLDDELKTRTAAIVRRAAKLIVLVTHDGSEAALLAEGGLAAFSYSAQFTGTDGAKLTLAYTQA